MSGGILHAVKSAAKLTPQVNLHSTLLGIDNLKIPANYISPSTYNKALKDLYRDHWLQAIEVELEALVEKGVLTFIDVKDIPAGTTPLGTRWILVHKTKKDGTVDKFKARLVAKGYAQIQGVDYQETFALVPQLVTFRLVLALSLRFRLDVQHIDVKTAFLNVNLDVSLYVKLPERLENEQGQFVAKLNKSLYGLKQAAPDWYQCSDKFIRTFDSRFKRNQSDTCLYTLFDEAEDLIVIILVYVDDYIVAHNNLGYFNRFCDAFNEVYAMTKLGQLSNYLQISVCWSDEGVYLSQTQYIAQLAEMYNLESCNTKIIPMQPHFHIAKAVIDSPTILYRNMLMSLMWVARNTRPDILYAVTYLSQLSI